MRTLVLMLSVCLTAFAADNAAALYRKGQKLEKQGKVVQAYLLYAQAAAKDPNNPIYWQRSQALQTRAAMQAKAMPKADPDAPPLPDDADLKAEPEPYFDSITARDLYDARKPEPPHKLNARPGVQDLDLQGTFRSLFEQVAKAYKLDTIFDKDYDTAGPSIRFQIKQADYKLALHSLEAATASFVFPLSDKIIMVAKDTTQKRTELEPMVTLLIRLPETTTQQDMVSLITAVQQSLAIQKVSWDTVQGLVVLRDHISKAYAARDMLLQLMAPRAQAVVDVKLMEVSKSDALSYGFQLPNSFPITWLKQDVKGLSGICCNMSMFGIAVATAQAMVTMSQTTGKALLDSQVRGIESQPSTVHFGQRYPIMTSSYIGDVGAGQSTFTPPPSFTFEDLGLSLKITTKAHGSSELTVDLETEFKLLTGAMYNGIPEIANRKLTTSVRLLEGQSAVIGGMLSTQEARTVSGIAGASYLPVLGPLVARRDRSKDDRQVLIVVTPHLIAPPASEGLALGIRLGSDTRPLIPL